jgi:steroid delta-isomerase-like uncharacterized protein
MTRNDNVELIDRWMSGLDRRNGDAFSHLYSDHAAIDSPLGGSLLGPDGVRKAFDAFFAAFPDAAFAFEEPCIDGDRVAIPVAITGTHMGGFAGLPATGKPFRFSLVFLLEIRDGKIVRDRRIYDFTGLLVQIGMLKTKIRDH